MQTCHPAKLCGTVGVIDRHVNRAIPGYVSTCGGGTMCLMSPAHKARLIKNLAADLGFCRAGIAAAGPIGRVPYLNEWLSAGRAGSMEYLRRNHHIRTDPRNLMDGAQSVIVTAFNYHQPAPAVPSDGRPRGRVAMYAWGDDYHDLVKRKLHALVDAMQQRIDGHFESRVCVDTVPILERELAAMAGVGWIGKNTMVLHQEVGSYFFLGEIVTTLELACDGPVADHCGSCTRCLDACPTGAFPAPYEMDASRCISYLTIEHRGEIPERFHKDMGDWIFGCDICQAACPHNRRAPVTEDFPIGPPGSRPILAEMVGWSDADHRRVLKRSAMKRATPEMIRRNANIAARNAST